jgi:hypothetical protein
MSKGKWDKSKYDSFTIKYNGEAVESHEMEADVLAGSLMGLSGVLDNSNAIIHGSNSDIFVKVKASPKEGSFEIDIVTMLTCSGVVAILNMVGLVGFAGDTAKSLIWFYKQSKGKDIESIKHVDDKNIRVQFNGCSDIIYIDKYIAEMYNNKNVRREVSKFVSPLKIEGMSHISLIQNGTEHAKISKEELEYFEFEEDSDPSIIEGVSQFLITQFNIYGKPTGWKLSCIYSIESMYNENDFRVTMLDNSFLHKVKNKIIIISNEKPTMIKATYRLTVHKIERTVNKWEILKVWEHTHEIPKHNSANKNLLDF